MNPMPVKANRKNASVLPHFKDCRVKSGGKSEVSAVGMSAVADGVAPEAGVLTSVEVEGDEVGVLSLKPAGVSKEGSIVNRTGGKAIVCFCRRVVLNQGKDRQGQFNRAGVQRDKVHLLRQSAVKRSWASIKFCVARMV